MVDCNWEEKRAMIEEQLLYVMMNDERDLLLIRRISLVESQSTAPSTTRTHALSRRPNRVRKLIFDLMRFMAFTVDGDAKMPSVEIGIDQEKAAPGEDDYHCEEFSLN